MQIEMEAVRRYLEKGGGEEDENASTIDGMPSGFFERFIMDGLKIDLIEPGRVVCSFKVPQRLLNAGNSLHGGATGILMDFVGSAVIYSVGAPMSGFSVEVNFSYLDAAYANDEVEIEAKALRIGKAIAVVSVELRNKNTKKIIAQGRHTKYLQVASRL